LARRIASAALIGAAAGAALVGDAGRAGGRGAALDGLAGCRSTGPSSAWARLKAPASVSAGRAIFSSFNGRIIRATSLPARSARPLVRRQPLRLTPWARRRLALLTLGRMTRRRRALPEGTLL